MANYCERSELMALRELPVVGTNQAEAPSSNGRYGAAHARTRDAYKDVPILQRPPWGHDISAYFYLGGVSCGSFVLGTLAEALGGPRRQTLARTAHYVAALTMAPCAPLLIHDLGKRSRFHHMLRIFKPSSPMNLGAWALTAHGALSMLTALRTLAGEAKLPIPGLNAVVTIIPTGVLAVAGVPPALALGGYTGVLIGTSSIPVWYKSPLLGGLFMASAMSTGSAAVTLVSALSGRAEPDEHRVLAPYNLALGLTETALLAGYHLTTGQWARPLLRGRLGLLTAVATTGTVGGVALEAVSLRSEANRGLLTRLASGLTLVGGAALRWSMVFAGHASSQDREGTIAAMERSVQDPGWRGESPALSGERRHDMGAGRNE